MAKATPQGDDTQGKIVRWLPEKGFGFIRGTDEVEYFFHRSSVLFNTDELKQDLPVLFRPSASTKGPRAEDVKLA